MYLVDRESEECFFTRRILPLLPPSFISLYFAMYVLVAVVNRVVNKDTHTCAVCRTEVVLLCPRYTTRALLQFLVFFTSTFVYFVSFVTTAG